MSVICPSPCRVSGGRPEEQVGCNEAREGPGMIVSGAQVGDMLVGDAAVRVGDVAVRVGNAAVRGGNAAVSVGRGGAVRMTQLNRCGRADCLFYFKSEPSGRSCG